MNDEALAELMYSETDSPPPTRVDLALVVRDGKRRRRRRAVLVPAVAGVAVLALAVGTAALVNQRRPGPPVGTAPTATATPAPAAFDPLRLRVAADWVPEGMVATPPVSAPTVQRLQFDSARGQTDSQAYVSVTVYAAGVTPVELGPPARTRPRPTISAAPSVNGRPAQLWTWNGARTTAIAWEWAPGGWAVALVLGVSGDQNDVVRRIAENVRTDVDIPIMLPFIMAKPPAPLRLAVVSARDRLPEFTYHMDFSVADITGLPTIIDAPTGTAPELTVSVRLDNQMHNPAPDRVIGGHPAWIESNENEFFLVLYGVSGYVVGASIWRDAPRGKEVSEDQAIAMALSVVPLGTPSDRSQWTNKPFG